MLLLNPLLHINVILRGLINQIVILTVHQFIITPRLIILPVLHMNHMCHWLTMIINIMRENMGNSLKTNHNRSENQILKQYIQKMDEIFIRKVI